MYELSEIIVNCLFGGEEGGEWNYCVEIEGYGSCF